MRIQAKNLNQANQDALMRAKMLDTFLWSDAPEVEAATDDMYYQIFHDEVRKRRPSESDIEKRKASIRVILLNLFEAWHVSPSEWVYLSLARAAYNLSKDVNPLIGYRSLKDVWDGLVKLGYVDFVKGISDKDRGPTAFSKRQHGYSTRMKATEAVISFLQDTHGLTVNMMFRLRPRELIVLKDNHKRPMNYEDTPDTISMRDNVKRINALLSKSRIELNTDNDTLKALQQERQEANKKPIDLTSISLHRAFSKGSFEQGGRFYGAWWATAFKGFRPHIMIDGMPTVEIDYAGMNPAMLYAKEGVKLDFDPYTLEGDLSVMSRADIQTTFYRLIFKNKLPERDIDDIDLPENVTFKQVVQGIIDRHPIIAKHFSKDLSGTLQYEDSCITEAVLLRLADLSIPALPIHDSFIVKQQDEHALRQAMTQAFHEHTGVNPKLRIECKYP